MGRGLPKKGGEGAWTVCRFRGGGAWQKKRGGIFEGGGLGVDTPMHSMVSGAQCRSVV